MPASKYTKCSTSTNDGDNHNGDFALNAINITHTTTTDTRRKHKLVPMKSIYVIVLVRLQWQMYTGLPITKLYLIDMVHRLARNSCGWKYLVCVMLRNISNVPNEKPSGFFLHFYFTRCRFFFYSQPLGNVCTHISLSAFPHSIYG